MFGRPSLRYNLFHNVHVLSAPMACWDARFLEAFAALRERLDDQGRIVVERPNRRGEPSEAATGRYRELLRNLEA